MKELNKIKSNWVGAAAGAAAAYFGLKGQVHHKLALIGVVVVGAYVGATVQSHIAAVKSTPTASTIKK